MAPKRHRSVVKRSEPGHRHPASAAAPNACHPPAGHTGSRPLPQPGRKATADLHSTRCRLKNVIYTLYISILLIVLTIHEYGHLLSAQIMGLRTARLQIGLGPTVYTRYSGKTDYKIQPGTPLPPEDLPVEFIAVWQSPDTPMTIVAWRHPEPFLQRFRRLRTQRHDPGPPTPWTAPPPSSLCQTGRVISADPDKITIATMAWAVAVIPLAAYVSLPESPHGDVPNCYNTTTWANRSVVTITGVAANIALFIAITLILPFVNNPIQAQYASASPDGTTVEPLPYHLKVADTTIRYYRGFESATKAILSSTTPDDYPDEFADPRPVCGPICAGELTATAVQLAGLYGWLTVLSMFTIFTAFVNILPFPPLDGWKLALNSLQAIRRKPFNPTTTLAIEIGAATFITFVIVATIFLDLHHHLT